MTRPRSSALAVLVLLLAALGTLPAVPVRAAAPPLGSGAETLTFHGDRERHGWNSAETALTPAAVASPSFGQLWTSPVFADATIGGVRYPPHLYASPLYAEGVPIATSAVSGTFDVVLAATSNGDLYAVNAAPANGRPGGAVLWSTRLGTPAVTRTASGGLSLLEGPIPLGILSTPVIDKANFPSDPRVYAVAVDASSGVPVWKAYAVSLRTGAVLPGWPVPITDAALQPVNRNGGAGAARFQPAGAMSQRSALNLSPLGTKLYVTFGGYSDGGVGWAVTVDTTTPKVLSAFSAARSNDATAYGGMWGPGGPAVDSSTKAVYMTTGNSPDGSGPQAYDWGETLLSFDSDMTGLTGTYTPYNYCQLDKADIDLGGSSPVVVDLDPATTDTPKLVTFGGKQGTIYLVDRAPTPGGLTARPACSTDSTTDRSLTGPARRPLNAFGPDSDAFGNVDYAKMRSTPAVYRDAAGTTWVYVTGTSKVPDANGNPTTTNAPPSVERLRIATDGGSTGHSAYLVKSTVNPSLLLKLAGSPVVSSNGGTTPVVWVLDANVGRSSSLVATDTPHPVLYALDGVDLHVLWSSGTSLDVGGKYSTPTVAHGRVYVGTDRVQAFGLTSTTALPAVADTYVRNGQYAGQSFGSATQLNVKTNDDPDYCRDAYFRFDLAGVSTVTAASLRVYGNSDDGSPVPVSAYAVASTTWPEASTTWNNRPPLGAAVSPSLTVIGTTEHAYDLDVTAYIRAAQASGSSLVSIALHAVNNGGTRIDLHSREAGSAPPQLVVR